MSRKHDQDKTPPREPAETAEERPAEPTGAPPEETPAAANAATAASEVATMRDRLLRLQADFDNFRKRTLRERNDLYRRANEDLMLELLPVLDHLELGLKTAEEHGVDEAVRQGFRLVYDQLLAVLGRYGLEGIDAVGDPFDPHAHESIAMTPSEEYPGDHVAHQTRRGYRLGEQLLRPAQVIVSTGPGAPGADEGGD